MTLTDKQKTKSKIIWFERIVYVFAIGCFIGFIVEGLYGLITTGKLAINKGMIYGPFNQIYGFGAILFTISLYNFRHLRPYVIFFISAVLGALFEYMCSYLQEIIFSSNSWEYTNIAFNINGRTSLVHAIFWGLLGVSFICWVFPPIERLILKIPDKIRFVLAWIILVFFAVNLTISALAVLRWTERLQNIPPKTKLDIILDEYYNNNTLEKIYPNMDFKF